MRADTKGSSKKHLKSLRWVTQLLHLLVDFEHAHHIRNVPITIFSWTMAHNRCFLYLAPFDISNISLYTSNLRKKTKKHLQFQCFPILKGKNDDVLSIRGYICMFLAKYWLKVVKTYQTSRNTPMRTLASWIKRRNGTTFVCIWDHGTERAIGGILGWIPRIYPITSTWHSALSS